MIRTSLSICLIAGLSLIMGCKAEPKATIQGVWTIEAMDVGIGENKRTTVPQAFMFFIMEKHYSAIHDLSQEPRPDWGAESPKGRFASPLGGFNADAGTYEYDGSTFVVHPQVAMVPNLMHGGSMTFGCQMEGADTLILTPQFDEMITPGMQMAPSSEGGVMVARYKFKRLE